jgi:hypothetical protein
MPDRSASVAIEVVIPTRNGAAHLADTLASIQAAATPVRASIGRKTTGAR